LIPTFKPDIIPIPLFMFSETHSDSQRADRILASIRREEARPGRGLLKIFFGMAPGVGKTCAMLEAAIQAADKGVQVIIGVAESHGREDTMRLIGRLPRLPMKKMVYRGVEMEEFDLEEALRVKPQLILVDELAHTNVPGMRHRKRYQDVEDLLAAGIDVYTTLNV
jgi:two-component system sensor histidine kinase KdpD